jgi:aminopeptidase N
MLQFFENGRFYLHNQKLSNYKVKISYPSDFVFATSGLVISESIAKGYTSIITQAKEIPSYGIVASQFLKYYELTTKNGILVRSYYFDGDSLWGNKFLLYAQKVLDFYCDKFGFYPQPILNIMPSKDEVGSGHPMDTNILLLYRDNDKVALKNVDIDHMAKQVIAHEIGHEYWGYNYILDSDYDPTVLGISLGLYSDWLYCSAMGLDKQIYNYHFNQYLEGVKAGYNTTITQPIDSIIKNKIPWNSIIDHGKKFVILKMLAKEIGEEKFFQILEYCLQNYKGINFTLDMFQKTCEKITNKNLGWFFDQWYRTNGYLDYQIQTVETNLKNNKYETTCFINRQGSVYMTNVDVSIRTKDSTTIIKRIDGKQKEIKLIFESETEPIKIEIDPESELPLLNRKVWIKQI